MGPNGPILLLLGLNGLWCPKMVGTRWNKVGIGQGALGLGQSVEKPRGYNGEWSPQGGFREFSMESLGRILKAPRGQTQGQKPEGPQAPRVFGRGSGRGGPSIYSRGTPLSTRGTSRGAPFTIIPPRLFHRLSFFLDPEEIKSNKTNKRTTLKRLPMVAPRVSTGIPFYQWWPLGCIMVNIHCRKR